MPINPATWNGDKLIYHALTQYSNYNKTESKKNTRIKQQYTKTTKTRSTKKPKNTG